MSDPRLQAFAERIERVLKEARDAGYDAKAVRKAIAEQRRLARVPFLNGDKEALDFLAWKLGRAVGVAAAFGISAQRLSNWRTRGISAEMRPVVWAMVNDRGGNLSREWLIRRPARQQAAAA